MNFAVLRLMCRQDIFLAETESAAENHQGTVALIVRPLSCPALGPRVIDRPRDSGFGGCCAASLLLLQRNRVAPLRSAHHRELSPRLALSVT